MANWKQDPQNREIIKEVSQEIELPIYNPSAKGTFIPWLKESWNKIEDNFIVLKNLINTKEPAFTKNTGFNLNKSDRIDLDDSNMLATSKAAKKLNDLISSLDICPYKAGDIYITTNTQNPALIWQGTTWQKIEGKFLKASANGENAEATGGRDSVTLSIANLPPHSFSGTTSTNGNHNHGQDSHVHSRGSMDITGTLEGTIAGGIKNGAFYNGSRTLDIGGDSGWKRGYNNGEGDIAEFQASRNWSGTTTAAQPSIYYNGNHNHTFTTNSVGSGSAFDIKPSYMVVHIWKRIS